MNIFRNRKRSTETGNENAKRFVKVVTKLATDGRVICMYPHPGWYGSKDEAYGWVWMLNGRWRAEVMELMKVADTPVKDAQFLPPDSLDGWSFLAVSTTPVPRVAKLSLDQTL